MSYEEESPPVSLLQFFNHSTFLFLWSVFLWLELLKTLFGHLEMKTERQNPICTYHKILSSAYFSTLSLYVFQLPVFIMLGGPKLV